LHRSKAGHVADRHDGVTTMTKTLSASPILEAPAARGQIDYDFYIARARVERSQAFRDALSSVWTVSKQPAHVKVAPGRPLAGANA
jgi:hypothetical protein